MAMATLAVRASNDAARALYREYGFYEVGERKRYYSDNREDAIIMSTEDILGDHYTARLVSLAGDLEGRFPGIELVPEGL
jgi:ribosomal-protein-alanine N-acetyltransferase